MNHPDALDPRLFHSQQIVDEYNADVAEYLAHLAELEYQHSKTPKRRHASRREQFDNQ